MANWWYESMFTVSFVTTTIVPWTLQLCCAFTTTTYYYLQDLLLRGWPWKEQGHVTASHKILTYCQLPMRSSPPQDIKHTDSWANGRLIFIIIITTLAKPAIGCTCYCWILICCTTTSHILIAITTYSIVIILHVLPHVQHLYYLPVVVHLMCSYLKLRCQLPSCCNMIVFPAAFALQPTAKDQFRLLFPLGKII